MVPARLLGSAGRQHKRRLQAVLRLRAQSLRCQFNAGSSSRGQFTTNRVFFCGRMSRKRQTSSADTANATEIWRKNQPPMSQHGHPNLCRSRRVAALGVTIGSNYKKQNLGYFCIYLKCSAVHYLELCSPV